jgi:hypothetical protein
MFTPTETNLASLNEEVTFSYTITYEEVDELTMETVTYPVNLIAEEIVPTVNISGGTISGYYTDSFNNTIQYLSQGKELITTDKFGKIVNLYEMVKYGADQSRTKVFNYTANAMDGEVIVDSKTYTITVTNDWTTGKNNLQSYVRSTDASGS